MLRHCIVGLCFFYVVFEYLDLPEGSPCSWKNVTGRCVSVYRCFNAMEDIKNKDHPPICGYQDKVPIICCTDCKLVNDTRLITISPHFGILEKTGHNKAKDKCLDYVYNIDYACKRNHYAFVEKVLNTDKNCYDILIEHGLSATVAVGGRDANRAEFPHMALLGYGETLNTAEWLCGGTVISERFILTAGHCLSSPNVGPVKYAALGILKRTDSPELWQRYNVKRAIPHPEYKPPSKYHDIALLETDKEISFNSQVQPACLHVDDKVDDTAEATGWGALGHKKSLADTLQAVLLFEYSEDECARYYPRHRHLVTGYNHTTQMCYGDPQAPKDTCEELTRIRPLMGDSGGPLQSQNHQECVYTILGVTSFGRDCGVRESTGIYTRVAHYVPWIADVVWP